MRDRFITEEREVAMREPEPDEPMPGQPGDPRPGQPEERLPGQPDEVPGTGQEPVPSEEQPEVFPPIDPTGASARH